jgi:2-oxoglutarate dehydrogenase E1 component
MVRAYQVRGHQLAKIDPLEINNNTASEAPELQYTHYGFKESDLERKFYLGMLSYFIRYSDVLINFQIIGQGILPGFLANEGVKSLTLREIIDRLQKTYCELQW